MKPNQIIKKDSTSLVLSKSRNLVNLTNQILSKKSELTIMRTQEWMINLWEWADANKIPKLKWVLTHFETHGRDNGGHYIGLPRDMNGLLNLKELNLSKQKLSSLHPDIGNMLNLESININLNNIKELPSSLSKLINLKELSAYKNKLISLPQEIITLQKLEYLELGENKIKTLPIDILIKMKNLRRLFLQGNQLAALPPKIGKLTNLIELEVRDNKLTTLPQSIGELQHLETLNISINKIKKLPKQLGALKNLQNIIAYDNVFEEFAPELVSLVSLDTFYLSENTKVTLTDKQKKWIVALKKSGCKFSISDKIDTSIYSLLLWGIYDTRGNRLGR